MRNPKGRVLSLDTETTGVYPWGGDRAYAVSLCNLQGETAWFRWPVDPFTRVVTPNKSDLQQIRDVAEDECITKVFFNAKFDIRMLRFWGIETKGRVEDTYFMVRTLRPQEFNRKLKPLCKKYLGFPDDDERELKRITRSLRLRGKKLGWAVAPRTAVGKDPVAADYWMAPPEFLERYGTNDAERTILLYRLLSGEDGLDSHESYRRFYERELELMPAVMRMEDRGVRVRPSVLRTELAAYEALEKRQLAQIHDETWHDFNPSSNQQLAKYVYGKLNFPVTMWTDKQQPSVSSEALRKMDHPAVQLIREYASTLTAIGYLKNYQRLAVEEDGQWIIHPSFDQCGPGTGRFSCREPNLQNVPDGLSSKAATPPRARAPFCPRFGCAWWSYDYDSQEAWIFADGANEQKMLGILKDRARNLHTETAAYVFGGDKVRQEIATVGSKRSSYRIEAKKLMYGIIYGMGVDTMAELLRRGSDECSQILRKYHQMFPGIGVFMKSIIASSRKNGYVATAWGRRIQTEQGYEYRASNYYVQGAAADIMKDAMIRIDKYFQEKRLEGGLVMTVHDEVIVELRQEDGRFEHLHAIRGMLEDHGGNLPGIEKLPVGLAKIPKQWDKKEDVKDWSVLPR